MSEEKSMNKGFIVKLALILFLISFIATLLLTVSNYLTKGKIAELEAKTAEKAKQAVIADAQFSEIKLDSKVKTDLEKKYNLIAAYKAEKSGKFAGYCIHLNSAGFGGDINMMVGINADMSFSGVNIISLSETPGLGAKATDKAFYGQFSDHKKGTLDVVKNASNPSESEINAISGATITSRAVTLGANNALEIAKQLKEKEAE